MKHSIASVSLPGDIAAKIEFAARARFDGIEIFENDLTVSDLSPNALARIARDHGIEIVALQPLRDFEGMPAELAAQNFRRARVKLELAAQLGARRLLVCSNVSPHSVDDPALAAAQLHELAEIARGYDIAVGYEALAWGRHVNRWASAWDIVCRAAHTNLGIVLDSYHTLIREPDVAPLSGLDANKIALVQLADAPRLDMGVLYLSRHYRCFPGQGGLAVADFAQRIHESGYDGYWSHEIFNDEFRASRLEPTVVDGKRSLVWLGERMGMCHDSASEPEPRIEDWAFVEFAVEDRTRNELTEMLAALGFIETHRHRSKDVGLMRLGEVSFVMNAEPRSYAHDYYWQHGTSVAAIGFKARGIDALGRRARRLQYTWHVSTAPPGQLQIPAVTGTVGNLFYFVEADAPFADVDFVRCNVQAADNGIYRIDHVAETVPEMDFLSTTLFYRAMLGLDVDETVDLIDPNGIVYSRLARLPSGSIRMPFNTSHSWGTTSRRFVERTRGGGVQQIALATSDIFRTVRSIDERFLLPMPHNYYEDLAARTDLKPARIAEMQKLGILYDATEAGCFLHCYTKTVAGIFFEIVQRLGHYDRYGEANAQVRLAAQMRMQPAAAFQMLRCRLARPSNE